VIMAEMITKRPLFPGDSEIDQLFRIFRVCGTPKKSEWPSLADYPDFSSKFPQWKAKSWKSLFPRVGFYGQAFLRVMMIYDPEKRPSAHMLLQHPYFEDITKNIYFIKAATKDNEPTNGSLAALAAVE